MIYVISGIIFGAIIIFGIIMYNNFISLNNRVINSWAQVNVQLKKRSDLIPKLVQVVKGYSKYEKNTLKEITQLRTSINNSKTVGKKYEVNNKISRVLEKFFIIAENYPRLKANENFLLLQTELSEVEDKIAFTRQFYNDTVYKFNTKLESFPNNIVANLMKLKKKESFDDNSDYSGVKF